MDKRAVKTRRAILEEFKKMICEMDCAQITVTELTERVGINRKTFYRHFEAVELLYEALLDEIVENYMIQMCKLAPPIEMADQTRVFFEFYCSQPKYVERLMCEPSYSSYCGLLHEKAIAQNSKRYSPNAGLPQEQQDLIVAYLVSANMGIYRWWVQSGKKMPIEELIHLGCILIADGYNGLHA